MQALLTAHPLGLWIALGVGVAALFILYLVYKLGWQRDYGIQVQRHLLRMKLSVENDEIAHIPVWWSDVKVQRQLHKYWKNALKANFSPSMPDL